MKKTLFMENTSIDPQQTAGEITSLLVRSGARQLLTEFDENGKLTGLSFVMEVRKGQQAPFKLPARIDPIFRIINGRRKYGNAREEKAPVDRLQAERVAWRQLLRWIQAQVALIETGMVEAGEVFSPYLKVSDDMTLWEKMLTGGQLALPPAPDSKIAQFERRA